MHKKKILALIPARGGSKGLPRKNIRPILGKPLICWSIEQAINSKFIDRVIVSTDDKEICDVAKQAGAEVPFIRPKELATDTALAIDVALHTLDFLHESGDAYDYLILLEPTHPLRKKDDIDNSISMLLDRPEANNLVSVGLLHREHPAYSKKIVNGFVAPYTNLAEVNRRQEMEDAYFPYGVVYLSKVSSLYESRSFYSNDTIPFFIERWQNYEIDDEEDFYIVENLLKKYL